MPVLSIILPLSDQMTQTVIFKFRTRFWIGEIRNTANGSFNNDYDNDDDDDDDNEIQNKHFMKYYWLIFDQH